MKRLLIITCILMSFLGVMSCEQKEDVTKYEIASDREISGPYMKAHKQDEQIQLIELYPYDGGQLPQKMQMDSPDEKKDKSALVRFHENDEIISLPSEVNLDK